MRGQVAGPHNKLRDLTQHLPQEKVIGIYNIDIYDESQAKKYAMTNSLRRTGLSSCYSALLLS